MHRVKDLLWTRLLPDQARSVDREEWVRHGGKWIIFDRKRRLTELADRMGPLIDSGLIKSAKYWNKDPGAICVYSLDRDRERTREILDSLGAGSRRVWEYDYAWDKNIRDPLAFVYSWMSKLSTIIRSYGITGTLKLVKEILKPGK